MMKPDLVASNINAAPDEMPQKRLSFAKAEQWHDYALAVTRGSVDKGTAPVAPKVPT